MPATAEILRDLHLLHQRAQALRDRLASGPKTLAARQLALANRQAELEQAKKTLQDAKLQLKKHEHSIQGIDTKIDDLKVKLNLVKKNDEYKALQNQIAHEQATKSKIEEEMLVAMRDDRDVRRPKSAARGRRQALRRRSRRRSRSRSTSRPLHTRRSSDELETAIIEAESAIPEEFRVTYRRIVEPLRRRCAGGLRRCDPAAGATRRSPRR